MTQDRLTFEPTEDEKRNGWTRESLTKYMAERSHEGVIHGDPAFRKPKRPSAANSRYSPFRWR